MSLSQLHQQVLTGTLLGDGCLERNGKWVRLRVDHGGKQRNYVLWKYGVFKAISAAAPRRYMVYDKRTKRSYEHWRFDTRSLEELVKWRSLFYGSGQKTVPQHIGRLLRAPIALAVWFMDDGYGRKDCRGLHLNTQAFGVGDQERLQKMLERNFGLGTTIHWASGRPKLYFPSDQAAELRSLLTQCAVPGLAQKLA